MSRNVSFNARLQRKLTFRIDQKHYADLDEIAYREGYTVSFLVRHLVCRYIEQQRRLEPRLKAVTGHD